MLGKVIAGIVTFETIRMITGYTDTMSNLRSQVKFVTLSYEEAIATQSRLLKISNDTAASVQATTTLYTRTARAMKDYGKTQEEVLVFTESINNAMKIGGASAGEQASALLQLSQALGSGRLQGDEFRSISENAPIILELLAKNTGIARSELKKLGSEGKITSDLLFNAISKSSEELKKQAATIPETFESAMTKMKNNLMTYMDESLNKNGLMTGVASGIVKISENLDYVLLPTLTVAGVAMARLTSTTVAGMTASSSAITTNIALLYRQQVVIAGIGGASAVASRNFALMTIATQGLSRAMAFLGGPVGIAFLAATSISMYAMSTREAKKSTLELELELGKLNDSMSRMNKEQRDAAIVNQTNNLTELKNKYRDLYNEISRAQEKAHDMVYSKAKKSDLEAQEKEITLMKGRLADMGKLMDGVKGALDKLKDGANGLTTTTEGTGKASDEVLKIYNSLDKRMYSINNKGLESELIYKRSRGELGKINDAWFNVLLNIAKVITALESQKKKSEELKSIISSVNEEYSNLGKTETQKIIAKAEINGASPDELKKLKDQRAAIDAYDESQKSSKSDPFGDRLRDMSEELSKIQAQNAEIARFGRESLYTSAQQLTLEFNNQSSALHGVSDAQKQLLTNQAMAIDSQKQLNSILMLGSEYTLNIDQMMFELGLIGKTSDAAEKLTFMRDLDNKAKEISIGMSAENIERLNQEIAKVLELKDAYDLKKSAVELDSFGGMKDGFEQYVNSMGTVREQFATVTGSMFGGLTDAVAGFASGADQSFSDMTRSVLQNIAKMLIQMAILNAMKMAFGGFSNGGTVGVPNVPSAGDIGGGIPYPKWSSGGYTGIGGKYEPAGIVHKGEVVFSQRDVANHGGVNAVENMRLRGYANGGLVGGMPVSAPMQYQQAQQSSGDIIINITQHEDGSQEIDVTKDGKALENLVKVNVKKEIANQLRSGGQLARR